MKMTTKNSKIELQYEQAMILFFVENEVLR